VVTSEDPRGENAGAIIDQIWTGAVAGGADPETNLHRESDRDRAIRIAIGGAVPGDTVLLAGMGHEASLLEADGPRPWSERAAAETAIRERLG